MNDNDDNEIHDNEIEPSKFDIDHEDLILEQHSVSTGNGFEIVHF